MAGSGGGRLSASDGGWAIHPGLRARFRAAGAQIAWTTDPTPVARRAGRRTRRARLRQDEARVEEWGSTADGGLLVDSGPLGALVLMLAVDDRGVPDALAALPAGREPSFPSGAIVAVWGSGRVPEGERPRPGDVVDLARYALE